jgi:hypothetical protein
VHAASREITASNLGDAFLLIFQKLIEIVHRWV